MNVYDFDGTIYNGDSGVDFIKYSISRHPFIVIWHGVKSVKYIFLYKFKKIKFSELKEYVFSFILKFRDLDDIIKAFVSRNKSNIKKYYLEIRKDDDVVVSASYDFYLRPLCDEIGIKNLICSKYDIKNGKCIGENCKDLEKVKRFNMEYGEDAVIDSAYGDSKHDVPIMKRAKKGFVVVGEELKEYTDDYKF